MTIKTFVDANVLIAASKGTEATAAEAFAVLDDPERMFVTNDYLWLETMPKPTYNGFPDQAAFIQEFFDAAAEHCLSSNSNTQRAKALAYTYGLGAVDALHIQSALTLGADEFVTGEKKESLGRVTEMAVTRIGNQ